MRLPVIQGLIRRRLLVNFRVDPAVMGRFLPAPFRPKLHGGYAVAGICLIRLERVHPAFVPGFLGLTSENAAHRVAVVWDGPDGEEREGVYIPRRDTDSRISHFAGGRFFPGEYQLADFEVADDGQRIAMSVQAHDGRINLRLRARESDALPVSSCFGSLAESSRFFEGGGLGYSATRDCCRFDGMQLQVEQWEAKPLEVEEAESSFFADEMVFPAGSVTFDHGLVMRNLRHQWEEAGVMVNGRAA